MKPYYLIYDSVHEFAYTVTFDELNNSKKTLNIIQSGSLDSCLRLEEGINTSHKTVREQ